MRCCCKKRRKRCGSGGQRRGKIVGRVEIEQRCPRVEARSTIGHWESDTVIERNHKYLLVTLVERKTGFTLVRKVRSRQADGVAAATIDALKPLSNLVNIITFDKGLDFTHHVRFSETIGAKVDFADPYSYWQRSTHENWNGLLRQGSPKRRCLSGITSARPQAGELTLNGRARKISAWLTSAEALFPPAKRANVVLKYWMKIIFFNLLL